MSSIVNPYAKKKPKAPTQSTSNISGPASSSSSSFSTAQPPPSVLVQRTATSTSFSQVFLPNDRIDLSAAKEQSVADTLEDKRLIHTTLQAHALTVSPRQQGNPVLTLVRNVPISYANIIPDFIFSSTICGLFLTCSWHREHKDYIHARIAELGRDFTLRILLVLVNVDDNLTIIRNLNHIAATNSLTMILAWSEEEAARYLETLKVFDGKDSSSIQKRTSEHFPEQVADFLGKTANKTDSQQLLTQFSSLRSLSAASIEEIGLVQGMGPVKVRKLYDALHKPFSKKIANSRSKTDENENNEDSAEDHIALKGEPQEDEDDDGETELE